MQNPKKLFAGYGIKLPPRGLLPEKLQRAGVNATCYVAKLADGKISVIILNKDALGDVEVELDLGGVTTPSEAGGRKSSAARTISSSGC